MPATPLKVVAPETFALVKLIRPAMMLSSDVFPDPLLPIIAVRLPLGMNALTLSRTVLCVWVSIVFQQSRFHNCDGEVFHIGRVVSTWRDRFSTHTSTGSTARRDRLNVAVWSCNPSAKTRSSGALSSAIKSSSFSMLASAHWSKRAYCGKPAQRARFCSITDNHSQTSKQAGRQDLLVRAQTTRIWPNGQEHGVRHLVGFRPCKHHNASKRPIHFS